MILNDSSNLSNGFVQQVWLIYKGNNKWPSSGEDKYNRILMKANAKLDELMDDGFHTWKFFWQEINLGTPIAAGTQTYDLDEGVVNLAEYVYIDDADGNEINRFKVVDPQKRSLYPTGACFISGANPLKLTFIGEIKAGDQIVGGTIRVPVYKRPTALSAATDTIPLPNPMWLAHEVAAELARNDPAKTIQYPNIKGIANDLYGKMIAKYEGNPYLQPTQAEVAYPNVV